MPTIEEFHAGRLPKQPELDRVVLGDFRVATGVDMSAVDYLSAIAFLPMYANDRLGDCTIAAIGHIIEALTLYGKGVTTTISLNDVLIAYEAVSGYNPATGKHDDGAVVQKVLDYWRTTGVGGDTILAFAEVDQHNLAEVVDALRIFGALDVGINFPSSAMTQFNDGQSWDVVAGATDEGGHCIHVGGYDPTSKYPWKLSTWGQRWAMSQAFFDAYVDEIWVSASQDWFNAAKLTPTGLDLVALGAEVARLTHGPNPFADAPPPAPSPVDPPPVIDPPPAPPSVDEHLLTVASTWLETNHPRYKDLVAALSAWVAEQTTG